MSLYQQDVRMLTDEELKVLSEELREAHYCNSYDEDYGDTSDWGDDDAEARYEEMRREIYRRYFDSLTPEQQAKVRAEQAEFMRTFGGSVLKQLQSSCFMAQYVNREFDAEFSGKKIGDTITIKRPDRFFGRS